MKNITYQEYEKEMDKIIKEEELSVGDKLIKMLDYAGRVNIVDEK